MAEKRESGQARLIEAVIQSMGRMRDDQCDALADVITAIMEPVSEEATTTREPSQA